MKSTQQSHFSSFLIITGTSPESYSPAGERVRHLALASESQFNKVTILGLSRGKRSDKPRRKDSRVSLYAISFSRGAPYPLSVLFDPVKTLMLLAHGLILSRHMKPSCVLASMPPLEAGVSAWMLAKLRRIPLLIDLRDDWESAANALLKRYFPPISVAFLSIVAKKVYSSAYVIFAVTGTIANTVQKRVATKVLLVPNGADTDIFAPLTLNSRKKMREEFDLPLDKTVVVYCGSGINPYYRLSLTLSVIKALANEEKNKIFFVYYVYNGANKLKSFQNVLGISESQLEIRNPLPRSQLAKVLAACDVGLVPFDSAPYLLCARSTKIYEYLSSGLYVICSGPRGGELDVLFSSRSELGRFVLPSVKNFADAFKFVEENGRNALSEDSRSLRHSFIRENYDRRNVMKTILNALFTDIYMKGD